MKKLLYAGAVLGISMAVSALTSCAALAQQNEHSPGNSGGYDEIIITRKGNDTGNVTIQLNGSHVLINGQGPDSYKGDVTVLRRKMNRRGGRGGMQFFDKAPAYAFFNGSDSSLFNSNKALLGVYTGPADEKGAGITSVSPGSAAEKSGLKKGDVITKVDDKKIAGPEDLVSAIGDHQPGDTVSVTYSRDGKIHTTEAVLGKAAGFSGDNLMLMPRGGERSFNFSPAMPGGNRFFFNRPEDNGGPHLGMTIQDQPDHKGVKVIRVFPRSSAAAAGLKPDDIITEFGGKEVSSVNDVRERLKENKNKENVEVKILRNGQEQSLVIAMPSDENTITL